jgi:predicted nucleotidyltransferase
MDLKLYLEDLLGLRVDLATPRSLKARVRAAVERDAVYVT